MKYFEARKELLECWWCQSTNLTREHKEKKTDVELLHGNRYIDGNQIAHIKYRTENKPTYLQGSDSKRLKFEKNLCKKCNGSTSQPFDKAYEQFMNYFQENRKTIINSQIINLKEIFGDRWESGIHNIHKYIGKHIGCRLAENGYLPTSNLLKYLNGGMII